MSARSRSRTRGQRSKLSRVWLVHTTSKRVRAKTDAGFRLVFERPDGSKVTKKANIKGTNEREYGTTDSYEFKLDKDDVYEDAAVYLEMNLRVSSKNAWLPTRIFVIGQRSSDSKCILLAAYPDWNEWFSRDKTWSHKLA